MFTSHGQFRFAATALAFALAAGSPAVASHNGVLDKNDQKCRTAIAKAFSRAISTGDKVSTGCHKDRNKGGKVAPGVDCNVLDVAEADSKEKFAKAQAKLVSTAEKKCAKAGPGARHELVSCPEPCSSTPGDGGAPITNPMAGYTEVGRCLACMARGIVESRAAVILGSPAAPLADSAEQKCHQAIGKGYGKHLATLFKERTKCQKDADKALEHDITACSTADPKQKISKALTKASDAIDASCAGVDLLAMDSCSIVSIGDLQTCLADENNTVGDAAFPQHYQLPEDGTVCPTSLTLVTKSGFSPQGESSATRIDTGWNGLGHGQDLVHGYKVSVGLDCPSATSPCGSCTITGVMDAGAQFASFSRCVDDSTIACSAPFTADPACAGTSSGQCGFYLGAPQPASASNAPACAMNRMLGDISGTVDPDSGASNIVNRIGSKVHLGIQQTQPCPLCVGDTKAQDGLAGGTCLGGENNGDPCDVQATDATFAVPPDGVSLDCPPKPGQNVTGAGLKLTADLTTGTDTLAFGTPCDFPLWNPPAIALQCACAVCSGDPTRPCDTNACSGDLGRVCLSTGDCQLGACTGSMCDNDPSVSCATNGDCDFGTCSVTDCDLGACVDGTCTGDSFQVCATNADCDKGSCSTPGAGETRVPNGCSDLNCTPIGGGLGECLAGAPVDSDEFCDGQLRANGEPFLTCSSNGDCGALDSICDGGDCGDCEISKVKSCFVDPIDPAGTADQNNPVGAGALCVPPTSSTALNGATKLPGPARVVAEFESLRNFF